MKISDSSVLGTYVGLTQGFSYIRISITDISYREEERQVATNKAIKVFKWNKNEVCASIITVVNLGYEVYLISVGGNLLLGYTLLEGKALSCLEFQKPDGRSNWNHTEITEILSELKTEKLASAQSNTPDVLPRLPMADEFVSDLILGMIGSVSAKSFMSWKIKKMDFPSKPKPKWIAQDNEVILREEVNNILKELKCSRQEFADLAGISLTTLDGFLKSKKQSQESTLNKIRLALESLQGKKQKTS